MASACDSFTGKAGPSTAAAGSLYRSLMAQPHAAHGARIRVTEQGEVISLKYAHPLIARRNLEQLTSGVMDAFCFEQERQAVQPDWERSMHALSARSREVFRELVYDTPEFQTYFWAATPIDFVAELKIGSRPASRSSSRGMEHLRAIPWVFSWTQSRHLLSAWYGTGSALERVAEEEHGLGHLQQMYAEWPYFSMLMDNAEISLAKTDLYIAGRYASLVEDEEIREQILGQIKAEYDKSVALVKQITGHKEVTRPLPAAGEIHPAAQSLHRSSALHAGTSAAGMARGERQKTQGLPLSPVGLNGQWDCVWDEVDGLAIIR